MLDHRKKLRGTVTQVQHLLREQGEDLSLAAVSKRIKVGTNVETMRYWIEAIRKRKTKDQATATEINKMRREATE